jgi:NAD+ synthase
MDRFTLALAVLNPTVGDITGNLKKIRDARAEAGRRGADLVLFGELATVGYPPEDLVLKPAFMQAVHKAVGELVAEDGPDMLLSTPWLNGTDLMSAVLLIADKQIKGISYKYDLPNYGPFDEKRVFKAGPLPSPLIWRGIKVGAPICEDVWTPAVCAHLAGQGAEILLVANGSPYEYEKDDTRSKLVTDRARETRLPMVYLNQVGGQDELVFDGGVLIANHEGKMVGRIAHWHEGLTLAKFSKQNGIWQCDEAPQDVDARGEPSIYAALVMGLRDYVQKNGFKGVVLGLSGGIDSAICAAIAVDALGADRVRCIMMPSPYTSQESLDDASACAKALGCKYESISIAPAMKAYEEMLGSVEGLTAENIQPRARGMTLMAISNSTGFMVLSTGNKSEMSTGYATLYGDMCGGFNPLKDVYKMTVYAISRWRNAARLSWGKGPAGEVIPSRIISKAPSAELKPNQTDQDSLPPYPVLDGILRGLVERELGLNELVHAGYERATILKVWQLLDRAEYKRRQSCPGVKITPRSFGKDRRYPITNGFTAIVTEGEKNEQRTHARAG